MSKESSPADTDPDFLMLTRDEARICRDAVGKLDVVAKVANLGNTETLRQMSFLDKLHKRLAAFVGEKGG